MENPWFESLAVCTVGGVKVHIRVRVVNIINEINCARMLDNALELGDHCQKLVVMDCGAGLSDHWDSISETIVLRDVDAVHCFGPDAEDVFWYIIDQNTILKGGEHAGPMVHSFEEGDYGELASELVLLHAGAVAGLGEVLMVIACQLPPGEVHPKRVLLNVVNKIEAV